MKERPANMKEQPANMGRAAVNSIKEPTKASLSLVNFMVARRFVGVSRLKSINSTKKPINACPPAIIARRKMTVALL
jgi:hypothetical protein